MTSEQALEIVYEAIRRVNELRLPENAVPIAPATVLTGQDGYLDSLEAVTLVLTVEQGVDALTGKSIDILAESEFEANFARLRTPELLAALLVSKTES